MILPKYRYIKSLIIIAAVAALMAVVAAWVTCSRNDRPLLEVTVEADKEIAVTPQVVKSIRDIRQWEFVRLTDEEVIDTVRKIALWPDDRLVLIFHGTPRIGIDLSDTGDDWVVNRNDSLTVTLPRPRLLDMDFIDEALTEVFAQSGNWSANDREHMYEMARSRMIARALTDDNIGRVRRAAADRFTTIFTSLGAAHVDVRFADDADDAVS